MIPRAPAGRSATGAGLAAGLAVLVAAPWVLGPYVVSLLAYGLTVAVIAAGAHPLTFAGQPPLGQAVYVAVGAYAAVWISSAWQANVLVQLAVSAAAAAAAGAVTGLLLARLRGMTFLLGTVAMGEIGYATAHDVAWLGPQTAPPAAVPYSGAAITNDGHLYLYALACTIVAAAALRALTSAGLGSHLAAVAAGERRLLSAGISGTVTLWKAIVASAAVAGIAGHMLIATRRFVSPADAGFDVSALALVAAIIGGRSLAATLAAAITLVMLRDMAGNEFTGFGPAILAVTFVAVALLRSRAKPENLGDGP